MRTFRFSEGWLVPHPRAAVHAVLHEVEFYPLWWPQVRACVKTGPDDGVVLCRSALPYMLRLELHAEVRTPDRLQTALGGDLVGWVRFDLADCPGGTKVRFEQEAAIGGLLGLTAYAAGPVLRWNHARMMAGCRHGMAARLAHLAGETVTGQSPVDRQARRRSAAT